MRSTQKIRWLFRWLAVVLALAQVIVARNAITSDGISYIEIAQAYLRNDWAMTVNAYWGPLFSWLLAVVFGIVKPSPRWEFPVAHMLQFLLFFGCVAAFEFFWGNLLRYRDAKMQIPGGADNRDALPAPVMWILGYALFTWLTSGEVVSLVNPDLLVVTATFLITGFLLRIAQTPDAGWPSYIGFGLLLGTGYLTKAVMFPMAFVFLAVSFVSIRRRRHGLRLMTATLVFLAVALPEVALLSQSKGRLTFSDTGKLAFAWYNYGLPVVNWQGKQTDSGIPRHPTRQIFEHPPVFEFNGPIRASYPPWYDPSYWNEGLSPRFRPLSVAKHAAHGGIAVLSSLVKPLGWIIGVVLMLVGCSARDSLRAWWRDQWSLLVISLTCFGLYALTLVLLRYLAPWEMLLWAGILAGLRGKQLCSPAYRWVAIFVAAALGFSAVINIYQWRTIYGPRDDAGKEYVMAESLQAMGLKPGDPVASIAYDYQVQWAHLDHLSIVAEIGAGDICEFWRADLSVQNQVLQKFAQAGAKAVIANAGGGVRVGAIDLTCVQPSAPWRRIQGSGDYVRFLSEPTDGSRVDQIPSAGDKLTPPFRHPPYSAPSPVSGSRCIECGGSR